MKEKRIGMVGLGRMGANMARCLHDKGYAVVALYDRQPAVAEALAQEIGGQVCSSLSEVTDRSEVILTVVTDDQAMESIYFGADSLLQQAQGRLFINFATVSPAVQRRLAEALPQHGAQCLEACMASSIPQARQGELFLMVSGEEAVFAQAQPLLADLSAALRFVGPAGRASEVKALVNMVMNIHTAALAEGLALGEALGLDLHLLCDIFRHTGANSRVLETDALDMIARDHACYFSAEHAAKDSGIALRLAENCGLNLPVATATWEQFQRLVNLGKGHLDKSGVAELTFRGRLEDGQNTAPPQ